MQTYRDVAAFNTPATSLAEFVPARLRQVWVHNDPEFITFTYGDLCAASPRAAALTSLRPGDYLFFLARLTAVGRQGDTSIERAATLARTRSREGREAPTQHRKTGAAGFFLIGFLHIEEIAADLRRPPPQPLLRRLAANAHVRRAIALGNHFDGFWVFRGSRHSRRFTCAVPFTRALASRLLRDANGQRWRWDAERSELQVIGSYTRTCRCLLDTGRPEQHRRIAAWWRHVARFNPHLPVPELDNVPSTMR